LVDGITIWTETAFNTNNLKYKNVLGHSSALTLRLSHCVKYLFVIINVNVILCTELNFHHCLDFGNVEYSRILQGSEPTSYCSLSSGRPDCCPIIETNWTYIISAYTSAVASFTQQSVP